MPSSDVKYLTVAREIPFEQRIPFLFQAAGLSYSTIERRVGLARGSISAVARGRTYAYPKIMAAICASLAAALDEYENNVRDCLFPLHKS